MPSSPAIRSIYPLIEYKIPRKNAKPVKIAAITPYTIPLGAEV